MSAGSKCFRRRVEQVIVVPLHLCFALLQQNTYYRLSNLLDVHSIDKRDLELNLTVFLWPQKIIDIFDLSDEVILAAFRNTF